MLHEPLWDHNEFVLVPILWVRGAREENKTEGGYGNADEDKNEALLMEEVTNWMGFRGLGRVSVGRR